LRLFSFGGYGLALAALALAALALVVFVAIGCPPIELTFEKKNIGILLSLRILNRAPDSTYID